MNKSSVSCWDLAARDALRPRQADQDEQETKIHVHSRLALLFARRMAHVTEVVVIPVSCLARISFSTIWSFGRFPLNCIKYKLKIGLEGLDG